MSDGQPHPSAFAPVINGPDYGGKWMVRDFQIQVTSSRLALTVPILVEYDSPGFPHLIVWDWKTGVRYVVSSNHVHWYCDMINN